MLRHDAMRASAGAYGDDRERDIFPTDGPVILPSAPIESDEATGLAYPTRATVSSATFGGSGEAEEKPMEAPAPGSTEAAASAPSDGAGWFGLMVAFFSIFGLIALSRRA